MGSAKVCDSREDISGPLQKPEIGFPPITRTLPSSGSMAQVASCRRAIDRIRQKVGTGEGILLGTMCPEIEDQLAPAIIRDRLSLLSNVGCSAYAVSVCSEGLWQVACECSKVIGRRLLQTIAAIASGRKKSL